MNVLSHASPRPARRVGPRVLSGTAVAMAVVGLVMLHGRSISARAGDDAPSSKGSAPHTAFVSEIQRTLKEDDLRLIALAKAVLDDPNVPAQLEDQLDRLRVDGIKAEGESRYATLRREVADLALKEYVEAILPHDLIAAEAALAAAKADQAKARARSENAFGNVEKITAELEMKKAEFSLEGAESSKKVLVEYTKSKRIKDLESELAKARSDERTKKAEWERVKGRIEKTQKAATAGPDRTGVETRILALLDRAVPVEEQIQARLQQFKKESDHNDAAEKEVRALMDQLGAIIDEGEAVKAADEFARVKPRLRRTGGGLSSKKD